MVSDFTPTLQGPNEEKLKKYQELIRELPAKNLKPSPSLVQLVGETGSGTRRLALEFIKPAKTVAWVSADWNLYAPLLWQIAHSQGIQLLGIECRDRKRFRFLCKELLNSQVFDGWILDGFRFSRAEGFFLSHLVRSFSMKILILDAQPHSFCTERIHVALSHRQYRVTWSKGGSLTPKYLPAPYFVSSLNASLEK